MKTVYLTGAPGSGKTTALDGIQSRLPEVACWKYSERLAEHLHRSAGGAIDHHKLRSKSAGIVTPTDIEAVDMALSEFVASSSGLRHVIIDSHPVTKEAYGFRCTPFSAERLLSLNLDEIWVTYVDATTTLSRLRTSETGRQPVTSDEAELHTSMQASVAIQYGIAAGRPVYFFNTAAPPDDVVGQMLKRLQK
jgi:adenylate kinase